jgi:SAM-dependent MidA family methyltransferase
LSLEARLRERIQREGPISFYEWMKTALYDEREGYYCTPRIRQGRRGDYRTAPETSPLFAATFAACFANLFAELGSPEQFTIIEVGAGAGDFAQGVLTTLKTEHPEMFAATHYIVEEAGPSSRQQCAARLAAFGDGVTIRRPASAVTDPITGIVFSNELIDAFPVHRVMMRNGRLRELFVAVQDSQFVWHEGELEEPVAAYCKRVDLNLGEGQMAEINLDADVFVAGAAARLERGYVITVDYGADRAELLKSRPREQGTLRAFRSHQFVEDVLAKPGQQDLTTTIDWTQIRETGEQNGLRTVRFDRLDQFLLDEGILDRVAKIAQKVPDAAEAAQLTASVRELIMPGAMSSSFQVLMQEKSG